MFVENNVTENDPCWKKNIQFEKPIFLKQHEESFCAGDIRDSREDKWVVKEASIFSSRDNLVSYLRKENIQRKTILSLVSKYNYHNK